MSEKVAAKSNKSHAAKNKNPPGWKNTKKNGDKLEKLNVSQEKVGVGSDKLATKPAKTDACPDKLEKLTQEK